MQALIISTREALWQGLAPSFASKGCAVIVLASVDEAVARIREAAPKLVLLDTALLSADADTNLRETRASMMQILMANAMVNTAVLSGMDEEEAHDALEGLGIMEMLSLEPSAEDIDNLFDALEQM